MGNCLLWNKFTMRFVHGVEKCFYKLGFAVATSPWWTIGLCSLFVAFSSLGALNFKQETNPMRLWVPADSDFIKDTQWVVDSFKTSYRPQYLLVTAPNVLVAPVLTALAKINEKVDDMITEWRGSNYSWHDMCYKVPVIPPPTDFEVEISDNFLLKLIFCNIVSKFEKACVKKSILDLWHFNTSIIRGLNESDIIHKLNVTRVSPVLGHEVNFTSTLGGIERNEEGEIVSAKSVLLTWFIYVNLTEGDTQETGNSAGTEAWVSPSVLAWEKHFLNLMKSISTDPSLEMNLFYASGRSYGDISEETMFQDIDKLVWGIGIMVVYIILILSKFNCVEFRFALATLGLLCIGMSLVVAVGLCSLIGIPYGPVHASLPFLILGLGIDDMFVMKGCWDQLSEADRKLPLPNQIGLMLQHAGVSIIITSFTDVVAFLVGSITILPSLQSFCFYAAVGVTFVFVFSVTFYVAVVVIDLRRVIARRNGIIFCVEHPNFTPTTFKSKSISQKFLHFLYSNIILTLPFKIVVIVFTICVTGYNTLALIKLEQRFDPTWLVPEHTYFKKFLNNSHRFYPEMGNEANIFIGAINYTAEFSKLYSLVEELRESKKNLVEDIRSWTTPFRNYTLTELKKDIRNESLSKAEWDSHLSNFLFTRRGSIYRTRLRFESELKCGKPAPTIIASSIEFRFKRFPGPKVYLPAMHEIKDMVAAANFTTGDRHAVVWARIFANWVTDEVIAVEVERNLELALVCVMACTVLLITDLQMCLWILLCVLLTLVNVCGMMQRWGMTVDIVSCVGLELAVGLCVDYAAHVGHTFLTVRGSRHDRSFQTVTSIGAAVLYGGGSTFISISVLSTSDSYTFRSFFKIFSLVVVFGLFYGTVFLPVVLSLVGPKSYSEEKSPNDATNNTDLELNDNNLYPVDLNSDEESQ